MATLTPILCRACNKDITNAQRVRSPQGYFYCEACCAAAAARKAAQKGPPAAPAPAAAPAPVSRPAPRTARSPAPPAPPARSAPAPSAPPTPALTRCPNCDAPIIPGRKICIKCRLDTTKMDDIIARRKTIGGGAEEKVGALFSSAIKWAGVALIVLIIGGAGYMVYLLMHPGTVFDNYPTTREAAVRQMLGYIADGSDKAYAHAYELISFRLHNRDNPNEAGRYKMVYSRMHDDFASKYGSDWPNKAKIERDDDADNTQADVTYRVTLNQDTYHVVTEGQSLITNAVQMMDNHDTFPEDGKHHFGIADIEEYSLMPKAKDHVDLQKLMEQMRKMQEHGQANP